MQRNYSKYRKYYGQQTQNNMGTKVRAVRQNKNNVVQTNKLNYHNKNKLYEENCLIF